MTMNNKLARIALCAILLSSCTSLPASSERTISLATNADDFRIVAASLSGSQVCVRGLLIMGPHGVYMPTSNDEPHLLYGNRVNLALPFREAIAMGLVADRHYEFCGVIEAVAAVDGRGENQGIFILTDPMLHR